MPIAQPNDDLPRAGRGDGNPPDANPRFGQLLAEKWHELDRQRDENHQKSRTDVDRYIRLGWAGKCARELGYRLLDVPASNPPDLAAQWRMGIGTMVHDRWQEVLTVAFPDASIEHVIGKEHDETFGFPISGRTDVYLVESADASLGASLESTRPGVSPDEGTATDSADQGPNPSGASAPSTRRIAIELKTINGFGFKMAVGERGLAEGPRSGALFQAAMNGRALDADEVVIVLLSLECLSDRALGNVVRNAGGEARPDRKFVAEWTYPMAELDEMVDREIKRLTKVLAMVDARAMALDELANQDEGGPTEVLDLAPLPPRSIPLEMPARARITDPKKGAWHLVIDGNVMDAGTTWMCGYCSWQDQCIKDGGS